MVYLVQYREEIKDLGSFLVGEEKTNYFIRNLTRTKQDKKLQGEPRCVLPSNLPVHIVPFIWANSTILRQSVS